jgi:hypothetical protein
MSNVGLAMPTLASADVKKEKIQGERDATRRELGSTKLELKSSQSFRIEQAAI